MNFIIIFLEQNKFIYYLIIKINFFSLYFFNEMFLQFSCEQYDLIYNLKKISSILLFQNSWKVNKISNYTKHENKFLFFFFSC